MNEIYVYEGQEFEVAPHRLQEFLEQYPGATKVEEPGKTTDSPVETQAASQDVTGSQSEDGSLGWFQQAWQAGKTNADLYDDADAIFDISSSKEARELSDKELQAYIDLIDKSKESAAQMEELDKFTKAFNKHNQKGENWLMSTINAVKDNGGVFGGGMKGFAQSTIQSYRSMVNEELAKEAIAPTVTAAGGGALVGGVGAIPAGLAGLFGSMNYGLETIHTFNELLEEEIKNAKLDFTPENIRKIMSDDKIRSDIKSKARKRGFTIGTVEGLTNLVGVKGAGAVLKAGEDAVSVIGKAATKTGAGLTSATAEAVGGGAGEYLGGKVIGKDASGVDIVLESLSMGATKAPIDVTVAAYDLARKQPSYKINGKKVSKKSVEDYVNDSRTAEEISSLNIDIKNDNAFSNKIKARVDNILLKSQVDAKIEDPSDRQRMVDLEKQRRNAENDAKKTGIQAVPGAKETLESIEEQMNEIVGKYTAIDGRTADVRARKKTAQQVRENIADKNFEANLDFAKKHSKLYGLEVEDNLTQEQIKEKYGDDLANSLGGIVDNKLVINKKLAKTRVYGDNVANHELLHGIIKASGQQKDITQKTIDDFLKLVDKK